MGVFLGGGVSKVSTVDCRLGGWTARPGNHGQTFLPQTELLLDMRKRPIHT